MARIRYLTDEHVPSGVAKGLRARGIEVMTAALRIELLVMLARAVSVPTIGFEQIASAVRQHNRHIPAANDWNRAHESFFAKVPQVAFTRIEGPLVLVAQVA